MSNAELYLASLLDDAVAKVPQARGLRDFLWATAKVRLSDIVDHVLLPCADHAAHGWTHVAPGVWRNVDGLPPLLDDHATRVVVRVDNIAALLAALDLDAPIEGVAGGPYRLAALFAAHGVSFAAVERCGWTGFDPPEVNDRQVRRARIHYQTLATRRRAFRDPAQGYSHLARLLEAAVTDLGPHWASGVFARAELAYWRAHCEQAQALALRQAYAGVGWGPITHIAFAAAREHFQRAASVARMLGYRPDAWLRNVAGGFGVQVFACPFLSRPALIIECDGLEAPLAPLVSQTWFAPPGLWCALHGEGMLEGGARAVALRCGGPVEQSAERRPVNPIRVDALERERYVSRAVGEDIRLNGAEGAALAATGMAIAPYTQLAALNIDAPPPQPRRQRRRIKRLG